MKGGLPLVGVIDEGRVSNFEREWNTGGIEGGGALVRVFGHTDLDEPGHGLVREDVDEAPLSGTGGVLGLVRGHSESVPNPTLHGLYTGAPSTSAPASA